jgi:hypothetical protein
MEENLELEHFFFFEKMILDCMYKTNHYNILKK